MKDNTKITNKFYTTKNKNKNKNKNRTKKYRKHGGTLKNYIPYTFDPISNGEILAFLFMDLIAETQSNYFGKLIDKNIEFINSIQIVNSNGDNNANTIIANVINNNNIPLDFNKNELFRKFINDIIQWLLFDYNHELQSSIFETFYETLLDDNFLQTTNVDINYDILIKNVKQMIMIKSNQLINIGTNDPKHKEIDGVITLLRIFLRYLNAPTSKTNIMNALTNNATNIKQYKKSVLCILKYLIQTKLLQNDKVRNIISDLITDMTLHNNFSTWKTLIAKSASLVGNCGGTVFMNYIGF